MHFSPSTRTLVIAAIITTITGCAAPVREQPKAGFISDYTKLTEAEKNAYIHTSQTLGKYDRFWMTGPEFLFENVDDEGEPVFSQEDLTEIYDYYRERVRIELTENADYTLVDGPGEGVANIRTAVTALDETLGALNVAIYTKITGAGLGGVAIEDEIVDSETGEQLGASIRWGSGSRVLRAGFTRLGDARIKIKAWVREMRERIDAAHEAHATPESQASTGP